MVALKCCWGEPGVFFDWCQENPRVALEWSQISSGTVFDDQTMYLRCFLLVTVCVILKWFTGDLNSWCGSKEKLKDVSEDVLG